MITVRRFSPGARLSKDGKRSGGEADRAALGDHRRRGGDDRCIDGQRVPRGHGAVAGHLAAARDAETAAVDAPVSRSLARVAAVPLATTEAGRMFCPPTVMLLMVPLIVPLMVKVLVRGEGIRG